MRCPDCNKFVSFDTEQDPEIDVDINDTEIVGSCRIVNTCAECSQELKEANLDVSVDVASEIESHTETCEECKTARESGTLDLRVDHDGGSRFDEMVTKDRHGKPITKSRYMKHKYGAQAVFTVTFPCGEDAQAEWSGFTYGSWMEELV